MLAGEAAKLNLIEFLDTTADRSQALMLYAAESPEFVVEPEGNDWMIRKR